MPSRLDALRARLAAAQAAPFPLVPNAEYTTCAAAAFYALPALLAVAEAAQDCVTPCSVVRGFCYAHHEKAARCSVAALGTALAALTTEEE